jgi:hypothetical protein
MKRLAFCLLLLSAQSQAEVILSAVVKNGPSGYTSTGYTNTSTTQSVPSKHDKDDVNTSTVVTNGMNVTSQVQTNFGVRLEFLTRDNPFVISVGAFQDTTVEASIGVRLW